MLPEPHYVIDGSYAPLSRPLFIYVNTKSLQRPEVRKFVEFYLQRDGEFAEQVEYVAVPDAIASRAEEFLKGKHTGTVFLTADGKQRKGRLADLYAAENLVDTK